MGPSPRTAVVEGATHIHDATRSVAWTSPSTSRSTNRPASPARRGSYTASFSKSKTPMTSSHAAVIM